MAGSIEESVRRITERSYRGGHSASERLVKEIYEKSTKNLLTGLDFAESGIEVVRIYDSSDVGGDVKQVLSFRRGRPRSMASEVPAWLESLFSTTKFEIGNNWQSAKSLKAQGPQQRTLPLRGADIGAGEQHSLQGDLLRWAELKLGCGRSTYFSRPISLKNRDGSFGQPKYSDA